MKASKVLVAAIFICFSAEVYSGTKLTDLTLYDVAAGWGGEAIYVRINESITVPEGCANQIFSMPPDTPLFKENLSILLSAFHTNTKVRMYVDGCVGENLHLKAVGITK